MSEFNMSMIVETKFQVDPQELEEAFKKFVADKKQVVVSVESKLPTVVADMSLLEKADFSIYKKCIEVELKLKNDRCTTEHTYVFNEVAKKIVEFVGEFIVPMQGAKKPYLHIIPICYDDFILQALVLVKKLGNVSVFEYRPTYRNEDYKISFKEGKTLLIYTKEVH